MAVCGRHTYGTDQCVSDSLLEAGCFHAAHCLVDILMSIGSSGGIDHVSCFQLFPSAPSIVMSTFHCGQSDYQIRSRKRVCGKPVPKLIVAGAGSVFALPKIMMNRRTSVMFPESWFWEMEAVFWSVRRPSFDLCVSRGPSRKRSAAQQICSLPQRGRRKFRRRSSASSARAVGSSHSASTSASSAVSEASSASSSSPRMWHTSSCVSSPTNISCRVLFCFCLCLCLCLLFSARLFPHNCLGSYVHFCPRPCPSTSSMGQARNPSTQRDHTLCVIRALVPTVAVQPHVCHRRDWAVSMGSHMQQDMGISLAPPHLGR